MSTNETHDRVVRETVETRPTAYVKTTQQERKPGWRTAFFGSDEENKQTGASWGAIFAGTVITLATLMLFSLLGIAIGLGGTDFESSTPFAGVGIGLGIWMVLTVVIAFACGGYVAGALAVRGGFLHGLTTWATSTAAIFAVAALGIATALGAAGSLVGSVAKGVGSGASSVASAIGDGVSKASDAISDNLDVDFGEANAQTQKILADTGKPELQPDYLKQQLSGATDEVKQAVKEVVVNPGNYENILNALGDKLEARVDTISKGIDQDAIANSVAKNTELSEGEAQQATQNAINGYNQAVDQAKQAIEKAREEIPNVEAKVKDLVDGAKEVANDATSAAAGGAVWMFVGLLAAAAVTAFAGLAGSRTVAGRNDRGEVVA